MAAVASALSVAPATIGAVTTGAPIAGAAMTGVMAAPLVVAGGVLTGASRAGVAVAGRDGSYNCEKPSYRQTYGNPESSHGDLAPCSFAVWVLLASTVSRYSAMQSSNAACLRARRVCSRVKSTVATGVRPWLRRAD